MIYIDWWSFRNDIDKFSSHVSTKQQEILDAILNRNVVFSSKYYSTYSDYGWAANIIMNFVDTTTAIKLFESCIAQPDAYRVMIPMTWKLCEKGISSDVVKKLLSTHSNDITQKAMLCVKDITVDEEVKALRALVKSTNVPHTIYDSKYSPSLDALKRLPPIMRLNLLENLTNAKRLSYNLFNKITDEEEFKSLLFGASTKYNERVSAMWEKYKEAANKGIPGILTIKYDCKECGNIEVKISSNLLHSKTSLLDTRIRHLADDACPICGRGTESTLQVNGEIVK